MVHRSTFGAGIILLTVMGIFFFQGLPVSQAKQESSGNPMQALISCSISQTEFSQQRKGRFNESLFVVNRVSPWILGFHQPDARLKNSNQTPLMHVLLFSVDGGVSADESGDPHRIYSFHYPFMLGGVQSPKIAVRTGDETATFDPDVDWASRPDPKYPASTIEGGDMMTTERIAHLLSDADRREVSPWYEGYNGVTPDAYSAESFHRFFVGGGSGNELKYTYGLSKNDYIKAAHLKDWQFNSLSQNMLDGPGGKLPVAATGVKVMKNDSATRQMILNYLKDLMSGYADLCKVDCVKQDQIDAANLKIEHQVAAIQAEARALNSKLLSQRDSWTNELNAIAKKAGSSYPISIVSTSSGNNFEFSVFERNPKTGQDRALTPDTPGLPNEMLNLFSKVDSITRDHNQKIQSMETDAKVQALWRKQAENQASRTGYPKSVYLDALVECQSALGNDPELKPLVDVVASQLKAIQSITLKVQPTTTAVSGDGSPLQSTPSVGTAN